MRDDTPTPRMKLPEAASPALQPPGHRSGEGSASILGHLLSDPMRRADEMALRDAEECAERRS